MSTSPKRILRQLVPPALLSIYRRTRRQFGFSGDFKSWEEALLQCKGYEAENILKKVREAALKVKRGEAAFERDSVPFTEPDYHWPLLAHLLWIAAENGGALQLIDYGGSLGSTYFQYRPYLAGLSEVRWTVVEQPAFVECGNAEFQDERLLFQDSLSHAASSKNINVVLLSSVLPYVARPYDLLEEVVATGIPYLVVDRTPFVDGDRDRLTIQRVSPAIYDASYPAWFLSEKKFLDLLLHTYREIVRFEGFDEANIRARYRGFVFERRSEMRNP